MCGDLVELLEGARTVLDELPADFDQGGIKARDRAELETQPADGTAGDERGDDPVESQAMAEQLDDAHQHRQRDDNRCAGVEHDDEGEKQGDKELRKAEDRSHE